MHDEISFKFMPTSWNKVYHLKLIDQLVIMAAAIQLSEIPYGLMARVFKNGLWISAIFHAVLLVSSNRSARSPIGKMTLSDHVSQE